MKLQTLRKNLTQRRDLILEQKEKVNKWRRKLVLKVSR
jgi:hypothetical protein